MSSRSRSSISSSIGNSADFDGNLTLNDRLKVFKTSHFDPNAYVTSKCQTMSEKEIRHLCSYLVDLKKASAEEMRRSVYANYSAFIRTSKEISDLEGELLSMRNLLSTQSALLHNLSEGARIDSLSASSQDSKTDDISNFEDREPSQIEKWLVEFLDSLDVLLAERRTNEALSALTEGENIAKEAKNKQTLSPAKYLSLKNSITEQRTKLADQLVESACQPSTSGVELRSAVSALKKLGDGPRANSLLLNSHHQKLQFNMQRIRPSSSFYGGAYTATLSRPVFSTIAQAATDSLTIFGEEPAYTSKLVTWAVKQTENFAHLIKKNALGPSAAVGCLRAANDCFQICLRHCSSLEARGLALSPVLLKMFRPSIEEALNANLKRVEQSSAALAADDDWLLAYLPVGARLMGSAVASQPKLSGSAHRFNSMIQEIFEDVEPLKILQLGGATLEGLLKVFNSYINMLINALPGSVENEANLSEHIMNRTVKIAETEAQQIALLANASLLAEDLLPRAAMKLLPLNQHSRVEEQPRRATDRQRDWKRRLQRSVDRLRDSFCRLHALDLIFTEEGDVRLNSEMYLCMDENADDPEWFPSRIFQELFAILSHIASIATEMFVGRERSATILLMRLTETVVLWISDDQSFWQEIEEGPRSLGPLGLQQFYLDMEFVILFSSQGHYLSRHLHQVIKNIIARAIDAVAATGIDPYSVLPEDEWFADVAQIAIKMLTGKANFGNIERENASPTASASEKSIASVVSHGSN